MKKESSPRRIAASRANGAKSKGPKTPEGKARSSMNALKTGLAATTAILLSVEDHDEFLRSRDAYIKRFRPIDEVELACVDEMVVCRSLQARTWVMESAALDDEIERQKPEIEQKYNAVSDDIRAAHALAGLADRSKALALLNRYASRHSCHFQRAFKTLMELQKNRPPNLEPVELVENTPELLDAPKTPEAPNEPNPEIAQPAAKAHSIRIIVLRHRSPVISTPDITAPTPATPEFPYFRANASLAA